MINLAPASTAAPIDTLYYDSTGSGSPVLLLHGFMVRGDMYQPVLPMLAPAHQLIMPDFRGYGRSTAMPGPYTIRQMAEDMAALLDSLGVATAHVMGYSMGGIVAQQMALAHPSRVRSLTLACTWSYKPGTAVEWLQEHALAALISSMSPERLARISIPGLIGRLRAPREQYQWYLDMVMSHKTERLVQGVKEIFRFDSRAYLSRIQAPTLVVGGGADVIVPPYHSEQLARGIRHAELHLLPERHHGLLFTHPDELAQLLLPFWASCD